MAHRLAGSGIPTGVTEHVSDASLDALCATQRSLDLIVVRLDTVVELLRANLEKGDEVTARLEEAAQQLDGAGRGLKEELERGRGAR